MMHRRMACGIGAPMSLAEMRLTNRGARTKLPPKPVQKVNLAHVHDACSRGVCPNASTHPRGPGCFARCDSLCVRGWC